MMRNLSGQPFTNRSTVNSTCLLVLLFCACFSSPAMAGSEVDEAIQKVKALKADTKGMVSFPGGTFVMGNNAGEKDEMPEHSVTVTPFWIDRYEVSNADYDNYLLKINPSQPRHNSGENLNNPDQPAVMLNWNEADAYCRSMGKRLPSEAEYEYLLRLLGKQINGNDNPFIPRTEYTKGFNFFGKKDRFPFTAPVSEFSRISLSGVANLLGNVWEWTGDGYAPYSVKESGREQEKVLRGGSWVNIPSKNYQTYRATSHPDARTESYGFRCALDEKK